MKKRFLLFTALVVALVCLLAITVSAENKIIKHTTLPTLAEIHANPSEYISRLDTFETGDTYKVYREADPNSVVVLTDLAETPTYYVYPSYYFVPKTVYQLWSHLPNLNAAITETGIDAFAGYTAIDNSWAQGGCKYVVRIEVPTYLTTIQGTGKFEGSTALKEIYFPTKTVIDPDTNLEKVITCVTSISGENLFGGCSSLEVIHNMGLLPTGLVQGNNAGFSGCSKLTKFEVPYGVTHIPNYFFKDCSSLKELIMPNSLVSVGKQAFANCKKLETLNFGASFNKFYSPNNDYETCMGTNGLKFVYLPATFADNITATNNQFKNIFNGSGKTIYFVTEKDYDKVVTIQSNFKATNANKNIANATIEAYDPNKNYTTYQAGLSNSVIVYAYNNCDAFYNGEHDLDITDCTIGDDCSRCQVVVKESSHALVNTLTYPNGFDKKGVYNYHCTNSCCTMDGEEIIDQEVDEIITFLGYSVPETAGVKGINAGFKVEKDLLEDYNEINDTDATLTLFMVNCKSENVNISKIFEDGTLELADGVKGINVAITSTSYTNISVEVRGFDDSSVTGNYYTLKLITAIAVKTDKGTHFVQAGLKTGNDKQAVNGVDFNIVSAENVYSAVAE